MTAELCGFPRWLIAATAALLAVKAWFAATLDLFGDGAFYWLEARNLAFAYSDLPPATALVIRAGDRIVAAQNTNRQCLRGRIERAHEEAPDVSSASVARGAARLSIWVSASSARMRSITWASRERTSWLRCTSAACVATIARIRQEQRRSSRWWIMDCGCTFASAFHLAAARGRRADAGAPTTPTLPTTPSARRRKSSRVAANHPLASPQILRAMSYTPQSVAAYVELLHTDHTRTAEANAALKVFLVKLALHPARVGPFNTPLAAPNDPVFWSSHSNWERLWHYAQVHPELAYPSGPKATASLKAQWDYVHAIPMLRNGTCWGVYWNATLPFSDFGGESDADQEFSDDEAQAAALAKVVI